MTDAPDIRVDYLGSICMITPMTQEGRDWIAENVKTESWQWIRDSIGVDSRYADPIAEGAQDDGLAVERVY